MTRWHTRAKYFYRSWLRLFQARFLGDASSWKCKGVKKQILQRLQWMKHCMHCGKHLNAWPFCKCCGCTWRTLIELKWTWCSALCTEALVLGRIVGGVGCHWQQKVDTLLAGTWSKWDGWGLKENEKVEEKKEEEVLAASWPESDIRRQPRRC